MMDNRVFNVNGRGLDMLEEALKLAFFQDGFSGDSETAVGWTFNPDKGLVLLSSIPDSVNDVSKYVRFPVEMSADEVAPIVYKWLESNEAKNMKLSGWDAYCRDEEVENESGWRVFIEDWGHIEGVSGSPICAITPSANWLGK